MALSASHSRAASSWTTDLLDITHFPSDDGSRIEDSRIVRLVKKRNRGNESGVKKTTTLTSSSTPHRLETQSSSSNKAADKQPKNNVNSWESKQDDNNTTNINNNVKNNKKKNNNNNKPKVFSGGGALLKKLFGGSRRKNGKYEKSDSNNNDCGDDGEIVGNASATQPPITVKEYDSTSENVIRFNTYSRNRFTRDSSSLLFTNSMSIDSSVAAVEGNSANDVEDEDDVHDNKIKDLNSNCVEKNMMKYSVLPNIDNSNSGGARKSDGVKYVTVKTSSLSKFDNINDTFTEATETSLWLPCNKSKLKSIQSTVQ